jgi:deoxyribodipyrimidine photo-lyase
MRSLLPVQRLNDKAPEVGGDYVLYWMQQSQRAHVNPALEHAVRLANDRGQDIIVGFGLMSDYPGADRRHFAFLLEGLAETVATLHKRGIKVVVQRGEPDQVTMGLAKRASTETF